MSLTLTPIPENLFLIISDQSSRPGSIIREYAFGCDDILALINQINDLSKEEFRKFKNKISNQDACNLLNAIHLGNLGIEPYKQYLDLLDNALSRRIYKSIIRSLLYTFIGDPALAENIDAEIYDKIVKSRKQISLENRLRLAANWQLQPIDCETLKPVLPTIAYSDVAELLIRNVQDQDLKDLCLSIWSDTLDTSRAAGSQKNLFQNEILSSMGIFRKVHNKKITDRQNAASKSKASFGQADFKEILKTIHQTSSHKISTPTHKQKSKNSIPTPSKNITEWSDDKRFRAVSAALEEGANPNTTICLNPRSPMQTPLQKCKTVKIFELLLLKGATVSVLDLKGNSLLHEACAYDKISMAEALIKNRADIDAQNHLGQTALHLAFSNASLQTAELLVNLGANFHIKNNSNQSPIDTALEILEKFKKSISKADEWDNQDLKEKLAAQTRKIQELIKKMQTMQPQKKLGSILSTSQGRSPSMITQVSLRGRPSRAARDSISQKVLEQGPSLAVQPIQASPSKFRKLANRIKRLFSCCSCTCCLTNRIQPLQVQDGRYVWN
jgi:hypothetical protein